MNDLASQLSAGILNEMKRRVTMSNINREKLTHAEDTSRMRDFFGREISRYERRKRGTRLRQDQATALVVKVADLEGSKRTLQQQLAEALQDNDEYKRIIEQQMRILRKLQKS